MKRIALLILAVVCLSGFTMPPPPIAADGPTPEDCATADTSNAAFMHECAEYIVTAEYRMDFDWGWFEWEDRCELTREYTRTTTTTTTFMLGVGGTGGERVTTVTETETICEYGEDGECGEMNAAATH